MHLVCYHLDTANPSNLVKPSQTYPPSMLLLPAGGFCGFWRPAVALSECACHLQVWPSREAERIARASACKPTNIWRPNRMRSFASATMLQQVSVEQPRDKRVKSGEIKELRRCRPHGRESKNWGTKSRPSSMKLNLQAPPRPCNSCGVSELNVVVPATTGEANT